MQFVNYYGTDVTFCWNDCYWCNHRFLDQSVSYESKTAIKYRLSKRLGAILDLFYHRHNIKAKEEYKK